jgi:quercetin dioxygenase-like cupin family protein
MKVVAVSSILAVIAVLAPFVKQERSREKSDKDLLVVKPAAIKWEKAEGMPEGVWVSHLTGESSAAPFVDMLKFARGTRIPLHWHNANHIVTVLSGTMVVGREGRPDETMGMEIPAGGFARITAKMPHWTMAKEDSIVVVSGDKENDLHWMEKEKGEKK